jgi:hypothetical protein
MLGLVVVVLSNGVDSEAGRLVMVTVAFLLFFGGGLLWVKTRKK